MQEFKTLDVLSKLEGLWLNRNQEIMYAGNAPSFTLNGMVMISTWH